MAALDDEIGIGADHRHVACSELQKHIGVILRLLRLVVVKAGADERLRFARGLMLDVEAVEERGVALGTEQKDRLRPFGDQTARDVA